MNKFFQFASVIILTGSLSIMEGVPISIDSSGKPQKGTSPKTHLDLFAINQKMLNNVEDSFKFLVTIDRNFFSGAPSPSKANTVRETLLLNLLARAHLYLLEKIQRFYVANYPNQTTTINAKLKEIKTPYNKRITKFNSDFEPSKDVKRLIDNAFDYLTKDSNRYYNNVSNKKDLNLKVLAQLMQGSGLSLEEDRYKKAYNTAKELGALTSSTISEKYDNDLINFLNFVNSRLKSIRDAAQKNPKQSDTTRFNQPN